MDPKVGSTIVCQAIGPLHVYWVRKEGSCGSYFKTYILRPTMAKDHKKNGENWRKYSTKR